MIRAAVISPLILAGCAPAEDTSRAPEYLGVETNLLDEELVQFKLSMKGGNGASDLENYAECAVAQYAKIRDYGFARHLRTNIDEKGGIWTADAVYTISPSLPRGLRTLDAEVVLADCEENGIPTV